MLNMVHLTSVITLTDVKYALKNLNNLTSIMNIIDVTSIFNLGCLTDVKDWWLKAYNTFNIDNCNIGGKLC